MNNQMDPHNNRKRIFAWAAVAVWTLVIFGFSGQDGEASGQLSGQIAGALYRLFTGAAPAAEAPGYSTLHLLVRKGAHMGEYCMLALLWQTALHLSGLGVLPGCLWAWGACVVNALLDEWRQTFVGGRAGLITDVLIDAWGALVGVGLFLLWLRFRSLRQAAPTRSNP